MWEGLPENASSLNITEFILRETYEHSKCGKAFSQSTHLLNIRLHTGEKPFNVRCGKAFGNSST